MYRNKGARFYLSILYSLEKLKQKCSSDNSTSTPPSANERTEFPSSSLPCAKFQKTIVSASKETKGSVGDSKNTLLEIHPDVLATVLVREMV